MVATPILVIYSFSPQLLASDGVLPWKTYLFVVMTVSLVIASFMSLRNKKVESRMARLLLTGLYFWVITFAQLTVLALIYYFINR